MIARRKPKRKSPQTSRKMITGTHSKAGIGRSVNRARTRSPLRNQSLQVDVAAVHVVPPIAKQAHRAGRMIVLDVKSRFMKSRHVKFVSNRPTKLLLV